MPSCIENFRCNLQHTDREVFGEEVKTGEKLAIYKQRGGGNTGAKKIRVPALMFFFFSSWPMKMGDQVKTRGRTKCKRQTHTPGPPTTAAMCDIADTLGELHLATGASEHAPQLSRTDGGYLAAKGHRMQRAPLSRAHAPPFQSSLVGLAAHLPGISVHKARERRRACSRARESGHTRKMCLYVLL